MSGRQSYEDIMYLPHHVSETRPKMTMVDRGAQFSPFAALTGLDAAMAETARLTETQAELTEDEKAALDEKIRRLQSRIDTHPQAAFTCFVPDLYKSGGSYVRVTGRVRKLDAYQRVLYLTDGRTVPLDGIREIEELDGTQRE